MVGFGKAVLGMATAVERLLGDHITAGLVSVPVGILKAASKMFPNHIPHSDSKIRYDAVAKKYAHLNW